MPILLRMVHNDLTNPIAAVHYVLALSISVGKAAGCVKSSNVQMVWMVCHCRRHRHALRHQNLGASFSTSCDSGFARRVHWKCFHYVHCDFALHSQIFLVDTVYMNIYDTVTSVSRILFHNICTARTRSSALEATRIHPFPGRRITMPMINPAAWKSFSVRKCWQITGFERFLQVA